METIQRVVAIAIAVAVAACVVEESPPAEPSSLGIADVRIRDSGSSLQITAVDQAGTPLGSLELTLGEFVAQDMDYAGEVIEGRRLTIEVLGQNAHHESAGYEPRQLPLFRRPEQAVINQFLADPRVASVLAEREITFQPPGTLPISAPEPAEAVERPYNGCLYTPPCTWTSCDSEEPSPFDFETCSAPSGERQYVCCSNTKTLADRLCGMGAANPCGPEGMGGCRTCWSTSWTNSCDTWTNVQQYFCLEYTVWRDYISYSIN